MWGTVVATVGMAALGCIPKRTLPTPASHGQGVDRPFTFQPPMELNARPDDAVVRLVTDVTCTGTLIADDLVLTAHHCVAARDARGRPLDHDRAPEEITVELGGDYLPWGEVDVRAIVAPDCGYAAGDGDIAILVLSRKLVGVTTMRVRLAKPVEAPKPAREGEPAVPGEEVHPIGFGRCAGSSDGIHRVWRDGGMVKTLLPGQFVAPASICPGDSGAPAYVVGTGEIVGVVSASVMDGDERTSGTSYFTRIDVWKNLFSAAREIADGAQPNELPPYRFCQ
jgi:hypothetical protein